MAEQANTYELTYIVNGVLSDNQTKDVVSRISKYIEEHGGSIVEVDEWGTRRLTYPIRKKRNGYYVNMYFQASGDIITRMERSLEIDDDVLRYLTLKLDPKMLRHYDQQKSSEKRARAQEIGALGRDDDDD
jgi:small subunit ribosomal protein S6